MDLEYWIDYVYLFGVKDFIPLYDRLDFITFRNWDVYAAYLVIFFSMFYAAFFVFSLIKKCFNKKVDIKND